MQYLEKNKILNIFPLQKTLQQNISLDYIPFWVSFVEQSKVFIWTVSRELREKNWLDAAGGNGGGDGGTGALPVLFGVVPPPSLGPHGRLR